MMDAPARSSADDADPRAEWDRRLKLGQCTLADAVMMSAHLGLPLSAYVVDCLEGAFAAYDDGDSDDLAALLGIAKGKREKNAEKRETLRSHVRFHVESYAAQGHPRTDPQYFENTAFHRAADLLKLTPSKVYDLYKGKR